MSSPAESIASQMEEAVEEVTSDSKKRSRDSDDWEDLFQNKKTSAIQRTVTAEEDDEFLSTLLSGIIVTTSSPLVKSHKAAAAAAAVTRQPHTTVFVSRLQPEGVESSDQLSTTPRKDVAPSVDSEPKSEEQQHPVPFASITKESRYQKLPPTILVERWTCDVCKSCSFETLEEAEIHEAQCKIFHDSKRESDGEELNAQMTEAWTCDVCKSCSFETFQEADIHEAQCKILRDAKMKLELGLPKRITEVWTCDVCKSCSFETFEEANKHETQCKLIHDSNTSEAADALSSMALCQPVQHEVGDDFADSKLPAKRHPKINLVPPVDSTSILSDYNGLLIRNIEFYYPSTDNRLGLRCIHCKYHPQHVTAATFLPSSIGSISSGLGTIGARHFGWGKCPFIPPEIVHQMNETKKASGQQTRSNGRVGLDAYCKNLAKQYGIVDENNAVISWVEGTLPNFDEADESYQRQAPVTNLNFPSLPDQSTDATDSNSIASVLASMKNDVNVEARPFVQCETEHFWECSGCRLVPFDFRARGSVVFSVAEPPPEKIEQHLRNCTGGTPLLIPQSASIEPYYGAEVPTIKVKWNSNQSQRTADRHWNTLDATVRAGVDGGELCFQDDQQYTTDFAYFTLMQLKKCHLTKAGGSRGACPVGFAGLACTHCAGQPNERRFFYTSADHLRNSFSHIPSHLAECNACPSDIKLRLEELKLTRNKQKSHLKPGYHKIFIDRVWERLHGTPMTEDEDTDDEGDKTPSFSTMAVQRHPHLICTDTKSDSLIHVSDRTSTSDLIYFTLQQVESYTSSKRNTMPKENHEESREIGFPGIVCRHCMMTTNGRKFFTTSSEHLGGLLLTIADHLKLCKLCPSALKSQITSYQTTHESQLQQLKENSGGEPDAHEKCMQRVWERLLDASRKKPIRAPAKVEYKTVDPNMSLVTADDSGLVTNYTYFTIQQVRPCNLDNSGNGSRSVFDFGFPGLECIHCAGKPNARRFFYRTAEILAGNYAHIPNHLMACNACPREIKNELKEKKEAHLLLKHTLPKGSQKQFFELVWDRLHGQNSSSAYANP